MNYSADLRFFARSTGVALVYAAAAIAGLHFAVVGSTVTLVWPPSGIALVALLAFGHRMSFGIALGAFLANAWTGIALPLAAIIAVGNTLEAVAGVVLLKRLADFHDALDRRRDVLALIVLAAFLSTMVSAVIGVFALSLGGIVSLDDYASTGFKWWLGDMMGVLVVAPLLLVWLNQAPPALSPLKAVEALCLAVSLALVSYLIFATSELTGPEYYPTSLAVFPFVIWGALRFEHWGAILVTLVASTLAIMGTIQGTGPLVVDLPVNSLMGWCVFANIVAATGLLLAASIAEQKHAQAALKRSRDELEQRVRERTQDLADANAALTQEMAERRRAETDLIRISEEQKKSLGRELHDGLGQHLTSLSLFSATLQHTLAARALPEASMALRISNLADQAIDLSHAMVQGLYPSVLESGGLTAALEQLAEHTRLVQGVPCTLRADTNVQVPDPLVAINLYRIAQEAIHNAVKHSKASSLQISLTHIHDKQQLSIRDDGVGITRQRVNVAQGIGFHTMRYRAHLISGQFAVKTHSPGGVTISVTYPG